MKYQFAHALFCENGHLICDDIERYPEKESAFCSQCGAAVISECPSCHAPIRGKLYKLMPKYETAVNCNPENKNGFDGVFTGYKRVPVEDCCDTIAYCPQCGNPYPWIEALLSEADAIVDSADELTQEQKETLKKCFPDLLVQIPATSRSALIASKILHQMTELPLAALKNVLASHLTEFVLSLLGWLAR